MNENICLITGVGEGKHNRKEKNMNSSTTKVVRFHKTGDASVLKIEDLSVAEPGEHELRFKVEAIGLNRAEVMFRNGAYLETPQLPSRLGYEAAEFQRSA